MIRLAFCHANWTPNKVEWLRALSCIQLEEQNYVNRLAFQRDSKAALVARLMIRKVISLELSLKNKDFLIERSAEGRPFLSLPRRPFDFNVSHHGDYTVLSAGHHIRTGIDVMRIELPPPEKSVPLFFEKLHSYLTPAEWVIVKSSGSEVEQMKSFFRHWCIKESYVKTIGLGLSFELSLLECRLARQDQNYAWCTAPGQISNLWKFEEHSLPRNHHVAITWHGENLPSFDRLTILTMTDFDDFLSYNNVLSQASSESWELFLAKNQEPPSRRRKLPHD